MLDVGHNPQGDVNVDLFLHSNIHRLGDLKEIPNLVCADCHFLPFKDNSFNAVFCSHLLEHKGVQLVPMCKELLRAAKNKVVIQVPNVFRKSKYSQAHDKIFSRDAFHKIFKNFKKKVSYCGYDWAQLYLPNHFLRTAINAKKFGKLPIPNPLHFLPCPIPTELKAEINKKGKVRSKGK